jgi:hypothetical protein
MTSPIPFDMFSTELAPGETIEWSGQPNPAVVVHKEDWGAIPFSLLWGGFAIFWLLGASGILGWADRPDRPFQWFGVIWGTPFVLFGQYFIWGRFLYARWIKQRTYYAMTSRRALIVQKRRGKRTASSAFFATTPVIEKSVRSDGIGSISFGGPVQGGWHWGKNSPPRCPTFGDIDNADVVYQIAIRLQAHAHQPASLAT